MRLVVLFLSLWMVLALEAKGSVTTKPKPDTTQHEANTLSTRSTFSAFLYDTLRNDSFLRSNFEQYLLPKTQLQSGIDGSGEVILFKPSYRKDWVFYYIIFLLLLILFIKYNFSKLFRNAISSFYDRSATAEIINDKYSPRWLFVIFANAFFVLVITLWCYRSFIVKSAPLDGERPDAFGVLLLLFTIIYFFKIIFHLLCGLLLKASEAVTNYILNFSITNLVSGIVMFILTLFLMYSPWHSDPIMLYISLGILGLFITLRYIRGLVQTVQYFKYNYLYLILYLCTLEIAPWFLIIKYLNKYL